MIKWLPSQLPWLTYKVGWNSNFTIPSLFHFHLSTSLTTSPYHCRLTHPLHFIPSSLPLSFPHSFSVIAPPCGHIITILVIIPVTLVTLFIFMTKMFQTHALDLHEIRSRIASSLGHKDLASCARVSQDWNDSFTPPLYKSVVVKTRRQHGVYWEKQTPYTMP